jgi:hypothetical protein
VGEDGGVLKGETDYLACHDCGLNIIR